MFRLTATSRSVRWALPLRGTQRSLTGLFLLLAIAGGCAPSEDRSGEGTEGARAYLPANLRPRVQEFPEGVTEEMVARGDSLFHGAGFCYACHGPDGGGVSKLGADLTDEEWRHTDGSYRGLVNQITVGVSAERSSSGVPMPPRGGGRLTDEQVRAVAGYVWVLGRKSR